ncbi:MAG: iron-containing alcohol dehydrogenase [Deltaproteobacteria bacterium]|nr:iron-containing alcohol dehydrogenase [Deltaproteobacteria bacterium]
MDIPAYYEFCCRVKTVSGHHCLEKIPEILDDLGVRLPLIITDKGVFEAGLINVVNSSMKDRVKIGSVETDVPPDSDLTVVNRLARVYREKGCDAIIAVGGGSVLDTAKGVNIVVSENATDLMAFTGAGALKRPLRPLIAIPTTSGTGSEVTLVAVIADHEKEKKMLFTSYFLLPDVALLDPRMTMGLPPVITSTTAIDALSHAVEAFTCLAKNPLSDAYARSAMTLIRDNLFKVMEKPDDKESRLALAVAANLAGVAFSNAMVGMVHTLGHSVGAVCRVPHGMCMAILLPYGLEYNLHRNGQFTSELLLPLGGEQIYARIPRHRRAEKVISLIREMNDRLFRLTGGKHARCFKEVTDATGNALVPRDKLKEIARKAMGDGSIFYNPEDLDMDDAMMVLIHAWEGTPLNRDLIRKG